MWLRWSRCVDPDSSRRLCLGSGSSQGEERVPAAAETNADIPSASLIRSAPLLGAGRCLGGSLQAPGGGKQQAGPGRAQPAEKVEATRAAPLRGGAGATVGALGLGLAACSPRPRAGTRKRETRNEFKGAQLPESSLSPPPRPTTALPTAIRTVVVRCGAGRGNTAHTHSHRPVLDLDLSPAVQAGVSPQRATLCRSPHAVPSGGPSRVGCLQARLALSAGASVRNRKTG